MRIVSGSLKGRKIKAPKNLPIRPTTDMSKESIFNILSNLYEFNEISVIDLFSGSGI
jgi:16S rRNA G966 N2-methylase RsmD